MRGHPKKPSAKRKYPRQQQMSATRYEKTKKAIDGEGFCREGNEHRKREIPFVLRGHESRRKNCAIDAKHNQCVRQEDNL